MDEELVTSWAEDDALELRDQEKIKQLEKFLSLPDKPKESSYGIGARPRGSATTARRLEPHGITERTVPVRGRLFGGLNPVRPDPRIDPASGSCYKCGKYGHRKSECSNPTTVVYCFNCGRRGCAMSTCPRCSDAYLRWSYKHRQTKATTTRDNSTMDESEGDTAEPQKRKRKRGQRGVRRIRKKKIKSAAPSTLNSESIKSSPAKSGGAAEYIARRLALHNTKKEALRRQEASNSDALKSEDIAETTQEINPKPSL